MLIRDHKNMLFELADVSGIFWIYKELCQKASDRTPSLVQLKTFAQPLTSYLRDDFTYVYYLWPAVQGVMFFIPAPHPLLFYFFTVGIHLT